MDGIDEERDEYNPDRYVFTDKRDKIIFLGIIPALLAVIFFSIIILISSIDNSGPPIHLPFWFILAIGILLYFGMISIMIRAQHDIISFRKRMRGEKKPLEPIRNKKGNYKLSKKSKIIVIFGIILILLPIIIFGAIEISNSLEESKFYGTWEKKSGDLDIVMMTLMSDNDAIVWDMSNYNNGFTYFAVYRVESGQLIFEPAEGVAFKEKIFEYDFLDEDTLILTDYYTQESSTYEKK